MNLFRSEDHVRNWAQFNPDSADGIAPLADWVAIFSTEGRKHLLDPDYVSKWRPRRGQEREEVLRRLGKSGRFWQSTVGPA